MQLWNTEISCGESQNTRIVWRNNYTYKNKALEEKGLNSARETEDSKHGKI